VTALSISQAPQSATVAVGGSVLFTVTTSGGSGIKTYQWKRNSVPISGATAATYQLSNLSSADTGATFSVTVTDSTRSVTSASATLTVQAATAMSYPIMFVTMVPNQSLSSQTANFSSHGASIFDCVPGGDLYIRYPDGTLRNLTQEAGLGVASGGIQGGSNAIAVREPTVHWDGTKALFSMIVGGPTAQFQDPARYWQVYEVTGIGQGQTVRITRVANQPATYNNISPIYGSDDSIIYVSDSPLYGWTHTYPQRDEYENMDTNTGIWKLAPGATAPVQIQHSVSGAFNLTLDSYGRILFTRWDHLKRDQQADIDRYASGGYGSFDYADETPTAVKKIWPQRDANNVLIADSRGTLYDTFPEALDSQDPTKLANESKFDYNIFFVWQVNQDGSEEETINHLGRHETIGTYVPRRFTDDNNLQDFPVGADFTANKTVRATITTDAGFFQFREDPNKPGTYLGVYAKEFKRQSSGRVMEMAMPPGANPEDLVMKDYTNDTLDDDPTGSAPRTSTMTGHYRNPLRLSNGTMLASHTPEYRQDANDGSGTTVQPRYVFQIKPMVQGTTAQGMIAGASLTGGINKNIVWWGDAQYTYNGPLNEIDMTEVRPRARPPMTAMQAATVEQTVMAQEAVLESDLRAWLKARNLALIVMRNVTERDRNDEQQPYNLAVPGGVQNVPASGKVYNIDKMQILQGELTRAYAVKSGKGRRVFVKPVRNSPKHTNIEAYYPNAMTGMKGAVKIAADGSVAALVPAGRALTWQLLSPTNQSIVSERVWVTFQPGEIRTCPSCHGINKSTINNQPVPTNQPQAFRDLLRTYKTFP
jgi:hypothetical protein